MSEKIFDGKLRKAIEISMKDSSLPESAKKSISYCYWAINHDLGDERDENVVPLGLMLASVSEKYGQKELGNLAREFSRLFLAEENDRKIRREKKAEKERIRLRVEKTFEEELNKLDPKSSFPGQEIIHFNSLYGDLTIPDSQYLFLHGYPSSKEKRNYFVADDERTAEEIYSIIEQYLCRRAKEVFAESKDLRRVKFIVGKELILPEEIAQLRIRREEEEKKKPIEPLNIGKVIKSMSEPENDNVKVINLLKKEGIRIGNKTLVDVSAWNYNTMDSKITNELIDALFSILKEEGFKNEEFPWLTYGYNSYGPGVAQADIYQLKDCSVMYVGELKMLQPLLPCGKTQSQMRKIWDIANDEYENQVRQIEKRELTGTEEAKNILEQYGITFGGNGTLIPCNYIKGKKFCTPGLCE